MEILGFVDIPLFAVLGPLVVLLLYTLSTRNHDFFKKRSIPGPPPYPLLGHSTGLGLVSKLQNWKRQYGDVFGIFFGREPVFVISDLEMLKEIFVKSFNNFRNRRKMVLVGYPFNQGIFFLEDEAWKRVRNIITPTFSSGKLRGMCPAINDCAKLLATNFERKSGRGARVDTKEHFGAFTMDVIARTAFGIQVDSQNDFNDPFIANAKIFMQPKSIAGPMMMLIAIFPIIGKIILKSGISSFFRGDVVSFFVDSITEMIKQRQSNATTSSEKPVDFLQLMIDAEVTEDYMGNVELANGHTTDSSTSNPQNRRKLTNDEIIGQCLLFFIAGYETTATTLSFATYALATNPDVQEKAFREIREVLGDEEPHYDNIGKLKYLENIITETLRLYPPVVALQRRAAEDFTIKGITIPKGTTIQIPNFALQRDPQHFTDPEDFRPERHDDKVNPLTLLSFGYGPRICIGMRLALIEAKIALIHVLRTVKFEPFPDTPKKLKLKSVTTMAPESPILLKLTPRATSNP